jgi:nitric oxide dioxygenase
MVERITHKHASLEVLPEHYPIVGKHLLAAIAIVLGEAATPEILAAWTAAYQQLAEIMIGRENILYTEGADQSGGWRGHKPFVVQRKVDESESICSFYLVPQDGEPLPPFRPGQYVSVKFRVPGAQHDGIRQYSLSQPWNEECFRISVKREEPAGLLSNYLHDEVKEGDLLFVHVPQGDFVLDRESTRPIVLLSAGSGITPALCMLHHLAQEEEGRSILFIYATTERGEHAFGNEVRAIASENGNVKVAVFYEKVDPRDIRGVDYHERGRISLNALRPYLPTGEVDFYYCGPVGFIAAVENLLNQWKVRPACRHSEAFAPDPSFIIDLVSA